jgi:hypothetical protein
MYVKMLIILFRPQMTGRLPVLTLNVALPEGEVNVSSAATLCRKHLFGESTDPDNHSAYFATR